MNNNYDDTNIEMPTLAGATVVQPVQPQPVVAPAPVAEPVQPVVAPTPMTQPVQPEPVAQPNQAASGDKKALPQAEIIGTIVFVAIGVLLMIWCAKSYFMLG
jgi:hypothetical protein